MLMALAFILFVVAVGVGIQLFANSHIQLFSLAFENPANLWITIITAIILTIILVITFISAALNLFNPRRKLLNKPLGISLFVFGSIATILLITMAVKYGSSFSNWQSIKENKTLAVSDTLVVSAYNPILDDYFGEYDAQQTHSYKKRGFHFFNFKRFDFAETSSNALKNDSLWCIANLEVQYSDKKEWELEIIRTAHGEDDYKAHIFAQKIPISYKMSDNKIIFNTHFYIGNNTPFRDQEITYRLWVPEGKVLKFEQGVTEIMNYALRDKITNPDYYGMVWQMGSNGLKCLDCKDLRQGDDYNSTTYNNTNFDEVKVTLPMETTITQSPEYKISITGPDEVRNRMRVVQNDNRITITLENDGFDIFSKYDISDVKVNIYMPVIEKVEAKGAGKVILPNASHNKMTIVVGDASTVEANITTQQLKLKVESSARISITGTAADAKIEVTDASKLEAKALEILNCEADISNASVAQLNVKGSLRGRVKDASTLEYKGKPMLNVKTENASRLFSNEQ
jgi:Putative auto-transporter adhesin, head GIN domain